jgi:phosphate-selective porin OprO/OprP
MNFNKKLAVAVSGAVLLMAGQFALADSTTDIVDALVAKGVLTEEEGKLISKGHETKKKADGTVAFKNGFKINSGDGKSNFSVNGRIQADYRYFDTPKVSSIGSASNETTADTFDLRRTYLGAKGTFRNWINWEATLDGVNGSALLKYFWLETAFSDKFKVRFGQYKMPMGLEQLTSSRFIDMTERDWVASMAPSVNKGVMVHGVPTPGLTYAVSVSNGGVMSDAGATAIETSNGADGKSYNARVTANIAEFLGNKEAIMHVGGAYGYDNSLPTWGAGALKFRTNARGTQFFATVSGLYTNPDITRYGLEGIGAYGPVKLQAEYANMEMSQSTKADRSLDAYYVNLSWMLTGETYASSYKNGVMDRMSPKNDFIGLDSAGYGAWELGVRYSNFDASDFAVADQFGTTAGNSTNKAHSYSAGIKWIVDPNTRFLMDYIYTDFGASITGTAGSTLAASSVAAHENEKAINLRAQFDF